MTATSIDLNLAEAPDASKNPFSHSSTESIHLLDPATIRPPTTPNREHSSLDSESLDELRCSIRASGGNLQPIQVRPLAMPDGAFRYDLVFGERRLRACLELNMPVRAMIASQGKADQHLLDRLSENRGRKEIAPLEFGRQVKAVIDGGYGMTKAALAERLGCNKSMISKAYDLASLPAEIIAAFSLPGEMRYEDMLPLRRAHETNAAAVIEEARQIASEAEPAPTRAVVKRLVQAAVDAGVASCNLQDKVDTPRPISAQGRQIGTWKVSAKGATEVTIGAPMSQAQREALVGQIESYIMRVVLKQGARASSDKDASRVANEGSAA